MKKEKINNRKGNELSALVENGGRKSGLVFVAHGLGASKDDIHISFFRRVFSDNDITVVSFDAFNSYGESGGSIYEATATGYLEDLEDVINWASGQEWYEEPFWLIGHSLGALCVAYYSSLNPEKVKCLIPASAVVSEKVFIGGMTQKEKDGWAREGILIGQSSLDISGPMNRELAPDLKKYDLIDRAQYLTMPVSLLVGEFDQITKPEHQKKFYNSLSGDKEMHIIKGAEHVFDEESEFSQIRQVIEALIKRLK